MQGGFWKPPPPKSAPVEINSIDKLREIVGVCEGIQFGSDQGVRRDGLHKNLKIGLNNDKNSKLRLLFWNIYGISEQKKDLIRNRLDEIENILAESDIIYLAETWLQNYDSVMFWDENEFDKIETYALRRHSKGRSSVGCHYL